MIAAGTVFKARFPDSKASAAKRDKPSKNAKHNATKKERKKWTLQLKPSCL